MTNPNMPFVFHMFFKFRPDISKRRGLTCLDQDMLTICRSGGKDIHITTLFESEFLTQIGYRHREVPRYLLL